FSVVEVLATQGNSHQIVGGYNPQSWDSSGGYHITSSAADQTAFLFNLTTGALQRQGGSSAQYQTYNNAAYGPTFGGGHDLYTDSTLGAGYANQFSYGPSSPTNILGRSGLTNYNAGNLEVFSVRGVNHLTDLAGNDLDGDGDLLAGGDY